MTKSVFTYRNGVLCAEAMPLAEIAEEVATPFYCTSVKQLHRNLHAFLAPFDQQKVTVNYTVKTNGTLAVLSALTNAGAGADVSCVGELTRAIEANVRPHQISFSGKGKTVDDIMSALLADVARINVETLPELFLIESIARNLNRKAPIVLRLDSLNAGGGFSPSQMAGAMGYVLSSSFMEFKGLALPCEGKTCDLEQYGRLLGFLSSYVHLISAEGILVEHLGLGAGPSFLVQDGQEEMSSLYVRIMQETLGDFKGSFFFESGKDLVGDTKVLMTRVLNVKDKDRTKIILVDASHSDLASFDNQRNMHDILQVREILKASLRPVIIMDSFGQVLLETETSSLPSQVKKGDLLAVMNVGTCCDMLTPEVMVSGAEYALVRRRIAVVEQMGWESCPDWVGGNRVSSF